MATRDTGRIKAHSGFLTRVVTPLAVAAALLLCSGLVRAPDGIAQSRGLAKKEAALLEEISGLLQELEANPSRAEQIRKILIEEYEPRLRQISEEYESHESRTETPPATASGAASSSAQTASSGQTRYEYDDLNRITKVVSNGTAVTYSYDAAGNRTVVAVPEPHGTVMLVACVLLLAMLNRMRERRSRAAAAELHKLFVIALLAGGSAAARPAFADLPGVKTPEMPPATAYLLGASPPAVTQAVSSSVPPVATQPSTSTEITPEIAELARALRYDVDLIYEYVYSQIEYNPIWGSQKGAMGALLDKTGNDFDQASLMVALLRESGYTASFVYGQHAILAADLIGWLGISNNALLLSTYMARAGLDPSKSIVFPLGECPPPFEGCPIQGAVMERIWVKVDIDGTDYVFDPAFKSRTATAGIDLGMAMGYDRSTLLSGAVAGATITSDSVRNLNEANLDSSLAGYAASLASEIRTNHVGSAIRDLIGGHTIDPLTSFPRQTSLPNEQVVYAEWTGDIPSAYRTTLRVALPGFDETFNTDALSGKRLTIFYEANRPVLRLEGVTIATGSTVTPGSEQQLVLAVDHALFTDAVDQSGSSPIFAGNSYLVLHDQTGTRKGTVRHHEQLERESAFSGGGLLSEPVLGESLAVLAASWLAQVDETCELAARLADAHCFSYHHVGAVGQEASPFVDVPLQVRQTVSNSETPPLTTRGFLSTVAGHVSAFEGGVIEQLQPAMRGVSTIALIGVANDQSTTFFDVTAANYPTIQPQLANYNASKLANLESYLDAGARVILPQNGSLVIDSWSGAGFLSVNDAQGELLIAHVINGMKGGSGSVFGTLVASAPNPPDSGDHNRSTDPIDLVTGDFLYESDDLTVGSQPFPLGLIFRKSYNSGSRHRDGPLGLGWTHSFDLRATPGSDGYQGFGEDSPLDAVGAIVATYVSLDVLSQNETAAELVAAMLVQRWFMEQLTDNIVTVSEPDRSSVFVQLPDGSYSPPPGSADVLSVESDGSYLLTTKYGHEIDYDLDGRIESWQDLNGNTVDFTYSGDHLQRVDDAAGHAFIFTYVGDRLSSVSAGMRSFMYSYDGAGNLTTVTDANSKATTFTYQGDGLLREVFTPAHPTDASVTNTYNDLGRVEQQLDARGNPYTYYIAPGVRSEEVDPVGASTVAYYDERGRTVRAIDALRFETISEYDGEERLVYTEAPEGNAAEFDYDARHNRVLETQYPKPGSPLAPIVRSLTYHPVFNRITSETDPRLNETSYSYDANGNLERIEQPSVDGQRPTTTFTYNSRGQVLTTTDPEGTTTSYSYDPATADLLSETADFGGLELETSYTYNAAGDRETVTDPRGNTVTSTFDAMRRMTQTRAPAPFNYLTRYTHDENGRITMVERQVGSPEPWQTTLTSYTVSGKVASITEPGPLAPTTIRQYDVRDQLWRVTDAEDRVTEFQYDERGDLKSVIDATMATSEGYTYTPNGEIASVRDGNGNLTGYRYDGFDRLQFTDFADSTSEERAYDPTSNVVQKTTRAGEAITYAYDDLNRLNSKAPSGSPSVAFEYDRAGRITEITDGTGTTLFSYDALGRRESVEDPNNRIVAYEYDDSGNRSRLTYPDSSFVTYEHDELSRLTFVRDQGVTALATFGYDSLSRRTSVSYANGTSTSYSYEIDNDVGSVEHEFEGGGGPRFFYHYDALHNRAITNVSDSQYVFDLLEQPPTTYTVNNVNQYSALVEDTVPRSLSYDNNGNLVAPPSGNAYTFDAENRLVSATTPSHALDFEYNAFGIRTQKTVDGAGTHYVLDGNQVIAEYDDAGLLLRRYVYAGTDRPIQMRSASTSWFYHLDALGSVVAITDASGNLAESYAYDPYGRVNNPSGPGIENPYLFAGREFDSETGLYYNRARYYDPELGRFLQPDPIGFGDGLNLYAYVGNDPVNIVDPLGLAGTTPGGCAPLYVLVTTPVWLCSPNVQLVQAEGTPQSYNVNLLEHEAAGGHTIRQHVGKKVAQMVNRLQGESDTSAVSTFPSLRVAQGLVNKVLNASADRVGAMMRNPGQGGLVLEGGFNRATGTYVTLSPKGVAQVQSVTAVRVILHKGSLSGIPTRQGFTVVTAFPVPASQ